MEIEIIPRIVLKRAFPGMLDTEAEVMVQRGTVECYPANTILCHEGVLENTFYILLDGEVRVTKLIGGEVARLMKYLHPGDFFGEMAIIHNAPRAATVLTTVDSTVLSISKEIFSSLLEQSSSMSLAMVREVSRRLRENDEMAIEDLRLKARELAEAYQQLAEQDYARRQFLTTIAHELRTPLMAASGFLQMIRSGFLQGDSLKTALDTVGRNVGDIVGLTNDILFLQEMDLILLELQPMDTGEVITRLVEQMKPQAEPRGVFFRLFVTPGLPKIQADSKSIERVFCAVLDNAVKFSPQGGNVLIRVEPGSEGIQIRIQDHGVGIGPEILPRIFDRFFHQDEVDGHLFRGVGLGLSIARQVVQQHHGWIEVTSKRGKGSTFIIHLKSGQQL